MSDFITITVDGIEAQVQKGMTVVDAAKQYMGVDIPVFCHHPKLEPVGMCRMCLVEVGMPERDRATGAILQNEDGTAKINYGRGLQTGCTVRVADGMVIRTTTKPVDVAREAVIEFLLTSHPLDCPICDKGGECPLQNLTMKHGEGTTRFDYNDKIHNKKHVPLGDLIWLDRERCIQCGRCTRYQAEIAGDPVIGFHNRGRKLEIVTNSTPGFDSYWSGNTTDICPVGALTTADFRFGARPWELSPVASISPHGPEGENITMSTRREAKQGGKVVIKRIMPRQNEAVNEIWISDRTRFAYHFAEAADRLTTPLIRKHGQLTPASWDEALALVADKLKGAGAAVAGVSGDRPSNEDLFAFQELIRKGLKSNNIDLANPRIAGGDVTAQVGLASGSDIQKLGRGDAILVVASDLHEEAPIWWLRVKQAAERGAKLVVLNVRQTRLDKFASHAIHYAPSQALDTVRHLLAAAKVVQVGERNAIAQAAETLVNATNLVAYYGAEGLSYAESDALARLLSHLLLIKTENGQNHVGRPNNGLVAVWPHNNTQGAWDMGINPAFGPGVQPLKEKGLGASEIYAGTQNGSLKALYVLAADPIGDGLLANRGKLDFLVVQELFLTETAKAADVVLPAQSWAERDGTFTNGERRVQRYYPAITAVGECWPDWKICATLHEKLGGEKAAVAASLIFKKGIAKAVKPYAQMDYGTLAKVEKQFPDVGGEDLYYGGTSYDNGHGLGQVWASAAEKGAVSLVEVPELKTAAPKGLALVRAAALYTPGTLINRSAVLAPRLAQPQLFLNEADAEPLRISTGDVVTVTVNGRKLELSAYVNGHAPEGTAVVRGVPHVEGVLAAQIEKNK
ncbi:MAG: NADH-quinone oxidoreductase subunit NuoG [Chloroflexi bacterium]|nr:NADH-quinone oxidoreductase subunit NuoG [Chloroflexota bacterium]